MYEKFFECKICEWFQCDLCCCRYGEAADTIRLEIGIHQENGNGAAIGRLTVALVLIQLVREDSVAAEKAFKEWGNYCDGQEAVTLEVLLQV